MRYLSCNLTGNSRQEFAKGREYIVAPMTLIVPGVLAGSRGPLLYPQEEVAKNPSAWDGVPIVLGHPYVNGAHVSAKGMPSIGRVRNARAGRKLTAEGWFDVEKTRRANPSLLADLRAGRKVEISTGLFLDHEERAGVHWGRPYDYIARNYRPDHLAVLVGQRGACSLDDGCGVNNCEGTVDYDDDYLPVPGYLAANAGWPDDGPLMLPTMNFDPDQPRDGAGRWTSGGGGSAAQDAYRQFLEPALGRLTLGIAPTVIGLATGGAAGGRVDEGSIAEAKEVLEAIFSRVTLGTGPLVAKAVAAGVRHSPKLFRLLVDGINALSGVARNSADSHKLEQLAQELEDDPDQLLELIEAVKAALAALGG